jgi:predicted dehydrogenase
MRKRTIGVVGIGYWGTNHLRGLVSRGNIDVVAIDPDLDRREAALRSFPAVRTVSSIENVLPTLDAVIICTPPATHCLLATTAMNAGVHVLIEKPMATSEAECRAIESVALSTGTVLMVGHTYDYNDVVDDLSRRVSEGELGAIRYVDSARLSVGGYRTDVNVMWDMAPHDIVIMRRILDAWPSRVSAWAVDHAGSGRADIATLRLDFEDRNVVGYIRVSWLDPVKVRRFSIVGTDRMAVFNESVPSLRPVRIVHSARESGLGAGSTHPLPSGYGDELISEPIIPQREPLGRQLDEYLHCIETGERPRTDGYEGRRVVQVLEAADLSASTGQTITLPAMGEKLGV